MAFHCCAQNPVDARLIAPAPLLEPRQNVRVKTDGELVFGRGPCLRCLREERFVEWRNVGIIDLGILHPVNSRQVALDKFFAHVDLPFSWR
jgi:hypothetical protein